MSITNSIFGNTPVSTLGSTAGGEAESQPSKAEFWMNFGIPTGSDRYSFLSLPRKGRNGARDSSNGIPLSLDDMLVESGSNENRQFIAGQNQLLAETLDRIKAMEPGSTMEIPVPGFPIPGFCIQIRRVNADTGQTSDPAQNPFSLQTLTAGKGNQNLSDEENAAAFEGAAAQAAAQAAM